MPADDRLEVVDRVLRWYDDHAPRPAVAPPGGHPLADHGQRVHAAADPGGSGAGAVAAWVDRWPTPAALAAASAGEAVRAWGRLGYPRRASGCTGGRVITDQHDGEVPTEPPSCWPCPASAPTRRRRSPASRSASGTSCWTPTSAGCWPGSPAGRALPPPAATAAETRRAERFLPRTGRAARWAVASMELGALVCTARTPRCESARSRTGAPGAGPDGPSRPGRGGGRRTRAPTGSAAAHCWPCCARPTGRWRGPSWPWPGRTPPSASGALASLRRRRAGGRRDDRRVRPARLRTADRGRRRQETRTTGEP